MIGEVIGNYRVVDELGRGGMGMVYRAEHVQLGRPAAIKMLLPQMSSDAAIVQRFFNEARAASAIDHPGIVEIYDYGTHTDGRAYIVMPLLKGENLAQRLDRGGPMAPPEGASIVAQVTAALAAAHARGIVHRDLKPDNIFLVPNEMMAGGIQIKLLDFGIVKLADEHHSGVKTQTGALIGTPAYMSPEQCMGKADIDHRTDLYSIGCILFHVLCGRPPFVSDLGTGMMIAAHLRDQPVDPRTINPQIPGTIAAIVLRLLEKDPAARFQSAIEARSALISAGASAPSRPPSSMESYAPTVASSVAPRTAPYTAREAVSATAPTTASGSAAELVPRTTGGKRLLPWLVVGGVLLALGGVGIGVAMRDRDDEKPAVASAPEAPQPPVRPPEPPVKPPEPPKAPEPPAPPVVPPSAVVGGSVESPCPPGQTRRDDTHGHCCWPEQAWSLSKSRCVGLPSCPQGTIARGEQCIVAPSTPVATVAKAPTFRLDAKSYAAGAPIQIKFPQPMPSKPNNRAWVTVVEANKSPTSHGTWEYVADGASTATLKAPTAPGAYEVRLHTNYPTQSHNVVHSVGLVVKGAEVPVEVPPLEPPPPTETPVSAQRFKARTTKLASGDKAELVFPAPMHAAKGEKFWVTVVEVGTADTSYGKWEYVPDGARSISLPVPTNAGDYELRLHANYPKKSTNVVHRVRISVLPP